MDSHSFKLADNLILAADYFVQVSFVSLSIQRHQPRSFHHILSECPANNHFPPRCKFRVTESNNLSHYQRDKYACFLSMSIGYSSWTQ